MSVPGLNLPSAPSPPPRLCKYRSLQRGKPRQYTLAILENLELRYSSASKFNDPFDCNLDISLRSSQQWEDFLENAVDTMISKFKSKMIEGSRSWLEKRGVKLPPRPSTSPDPEPPTKKKHSFTIESGGKRLDPGEFFNKMQQKRMQEFHKLLDDSFGVLCLSERPDDILLWSHYGNSHSGLCLEFNVADHPDVFPRLNPVIYREAYPNIPTNFPDLLHVFHDRQEKGMKAMLMDAAHLFARNLPLEESNQDPGQAAARALGLWFYVKSSSWSYELEWRCLKWKPGPQAFPAQAITRLILGCVNTETNLRLVRAALKRKNLEIPLYKAVRKRSEFGLDIVPAES